MKYDDKFVEKYSTELEDGENLMYEYKTGEFQTGEVIGMQPLAVQCPPTFKYKKDTTQEYIEAVEFFGEEGARESDLQVPFYGNCD